MNFIFKDLLQVIFRLAFSYRKCHRRIYAFDMFYVLYHSNADTLINNEIYIVPHIYVHMYANETTTISRREAAESNFNQFSGQNCTSRGFVVVQVSSAASAAPLINQSGYLQSDCKFKWFISYVCPVSINSIIW